MVFVVDPLALMDRPPLGYPAVPPPFHRFRAFRLRRDFTRICTSI